MNKKQSIPHLLVSTVATKLPVLFSIILLLLVLVVGSGYAFFDAQSQWSRAQSGVNAMDATTYDLTQLQQVSQIASNGGISTGEITSRSRNMLSTMNKGKCCTLDSGFATSSLYWLGQTATTLAGEKTQITDMVFSGDLARQAQSDVAQAYTTHEQLVKQMQELIVNWDTHFDADRDQRLKSAGDAVTATAPVFAQMKDSLSKSLESQRQQQAGEASQRQALVDTISGWRIKAYLAGGGVVAGMLLLVTLGVVVDAYNRANRAVKPLHERPSAARAHANRPLNGNTSVRKYGKHH